MQFIKSSNGGLKMSIFNPILFTLRESRCHPIFCVAKGSQYINTASPLDALKLGHPRLSLI
jgi:hypothetical protein